MRLIDSCSTDGTGRHAAAGPEIRLPSGLRCGCRSQKRADADIAAGDRRDVLAANAKAHTECAR